MSASAQTPHIGLSQYESDDRPSWLTDINADNMKCDRAVADLLARMIDIDSWVIEKNNALSEIENRCDDLQKKYDILATRLVNDEVQISQNAAAIANIQKQLNEME